MVFGEKTTVAPAAAEQPMVNNIPMADDLTRNTSGPPHDGLGADLSSEGSSRFRIKQHEDFDDEQAAPANIRQLTDDSVKRRSFGDRGRISTVNLGQDEGIKIANQPDKYQDMLTSVDRDKDGYITMDDLLDMSYAWHKLRTNYHKLLAVFLATVFLLASGIFMSSWAAVELAKETRVDPATNTIQTREGNLALIGSADHRVDDGGTLVDRASGETLATRLATSFANVTCVGAVQARRGRSLGKRCVGATAGA